jgi:hypothetical protein
VSSLYRREEFIQEDHEGKVLINHCLKQLHYDEFPTVSSSESLQKWLTHTDGIFNVISRFPVTTLVPLFHY